MPAQTYQWDVSRLDPLKNGRVFLTGGTGFFGKWLLRFCVETADNLGIEAVVLSRNPERFRHAFPAWGCAPNISFVQGDVRTFDYPTGSFDYVIHGAAPVGSSNIPYDSQEMYSIIVEGTNHVLGFAEHVAARRFLQVSSGSVYGMQPSGIEQMDERTPCLPTNAYGKGKLRSEGMCIERDVDVVIARCFAFVGEYLQLDNRFAIGNFILDCIRGRPIRVEGDGTPLRSYMHGSDLVEWLMAILVRGEAGAAYNVGSDRAISIADLARLVRRVLGAQSEILIQSASAPSQPPSRYVPSVCKASQALGLSVKTRLEEAVRATAHDWKTRENEL